MTLLGVKGFRAAAYAISAARHNRDDIVNEHLEGTHSGEGLVPGPNKGLEPHRKHRPILPDAYPEEDPAFVSNSNRTDSYESSQYNVTWDQSTHSFTSQGQFACRLPSQSRPGYSSQHHSDPYPGQHQPANPPNNHSDFPNQNLYGGASRQPYVHHQYLNQGIPYNQGLQGSPTHHQGYQQQYSNQGPPYHHSHQQQMVPGQAQENPVYAQDQQAFYAVPYNTTLRRASTTPVPCNPYICHHGTPNDSSCERCAYEKTLQRRQTGV